MEFKNLKELFIKFSDEEICKNYLERQRWPNGIVCPYCNHSGKIYKIEKGKRYKCGNPECYKKFSVTVGTIYESSKIPLSTWFGAMYICLAHKKGISSCQLARDLDISQKAAWFMLHRIREMMGDSNQMFRNTVEVDGSYIGGKEKNKHTKKKKEMLPYKGKTPVVGIVERGGQVYAQKIKAESNVIPILHQKVERGSTIMTDEMPAYVQLNDQYVHFAVNHRDHKYVQGLVHTNTIEGFWSLLKRGIIGIYHSVTYKHLNHYCDEFSYRYNTRKITDAQRFHLAMPRVAGRRLRYKELTSVNYGKE